MLESAAESVTRPLRIRLLLWTADVVYRLNSWFFDRSSRVLARLSTGGLRFYSAVSSWSWTVLMRHASTEEALEVGNRRLLPLGLELQRKPLDSVQSEPGPAAWTIPDSFPRSSNLN